MGFLTVTMLLGVASGSRPDRYAASAGCDWRSPDYMSQTLVAMVAGGVIGLALRLNY